MVVPPFLSLLPMAGRRAGGGVSSTQGRPAPMSPRAGDGALPKQGDRVSFPLCVPSYKKCRNRTGKRHPMGLGQGDMDLGWMGMEMQHSRRRQAQG